MNDSHFSLDRLLDDAATRFEPAMDARRLERALAGRQRRRGVVVLTSAAACLALLGGSVAALRIADSPTVAPAHERELPDQTEPKATEPRHTEPKATEPRSTEPKPTEPRSTEPKPTEPPTATTDAGKDEPTPSGPKPTDPPKPKPPAPDPQPKPTEPPEPDPTEPPPTTVEEGFAWSAFQVYGSCEENPPFDVFYGTAEPGATISVTSEFGSGSTTATEAGEWEVRVYFPDAPIGEKIKVWVSSGEHLDDFWFKRLG